MRLRLLILLLLPLTCLGMGRKQLPLSIRFYTETSEGDTESFAAPVTLLNGKQSYVDQIAHVSERDIIAIYPGVAADGSGSCLFQLDDHGTMALDSLSVAEKGTYLIAVINGDQVADLYIDQRISDGQIFIPSGISVDQMKLILKRYPVIGGKKKPKKKDVYSVGL